MVNDSQTLLTELQAQNPSLPRTERLRSTPKPTPTSPLGTIFYNAQEDMKHDMFIKLLRGV